MVASTSPAANRASAKPELKQQQDDGDYVWSAYRHPDRQGIDRVEILDALVGEGLSLKDARLQDFLKAIRDAGNPDIISHSLWTKALNKDRVLIEKALTGNLIVPEWREFSAQIVNVAKHVQKYTGGAVADYIPELGRVDPERFGVSICTVDGQIFNWGDTDKDFCIQSCSKPITYAMAVEENGLECVHKHVGREPSGQNFNELTLKEVVNRDVNGPRQIPHNPMINAGAIMSVAMTNPKATMADKFSDIKKTFSRLCGGSKVGFDNATYLSEKDTANRNMCLLYMMREMDAFPPGTISRQVLDTYFQVCSLEMNAEQMAVMAASLANGGMCPTTYDAVFAPTNVRACLSLMLSCGLYDYSGEWAFTVGLPAKSGVGGALFIVVPNKMGICIYSPRLDNLGNSVRGVEFAKELVKRFNLHHMDSLRGILDSSKTDPCKKIHEASDALVTQLLFASSRGDLREVKRLLASGAHASDADYDHRTALHLAAAENRHNIVEFFLSRFASRPCPEKTEASTNISKSDGPSPQANGSLTHPAATKNGSSKDSSASPAVRVAPNSSSASSTPKAQPSAFGTKGVKHIALDPDAQTDGSDGAFNINFEDRWGFTPLDDAVRGGHQEIAELLAAHGARCGSAKRKGSLTPRVARALSSARQAIVKSL